MNRPLGLAREFRDNRMMKACSAAAGILLGLCVASAAAQSYPVRPLRMIVPAGPGGGVDTIARYVATPLSAALGQPVVPENRPGAGTMLASELTARSPPDGYTLLMVTNSHVINAGIHRNLRYDPLMFSNVINSMHHVRARRLRALAITSVKRSAAVPELPTVAEAALPGYQADVWYGVLVPARTLADIVQRLYREITALLKTPDFREKAARQATEVIGSTPAELAALMRRDLAKWAALTARLKLKIE